MRVPRFSWRRRYQSGYHSQGFEYDLRYDYEVWAIVAPCVGGWYFYAAHKKADSRNTLDEGVVYPTLVEAQRAALPWAREQRNAAWARDGAE